MNLEGAMEKRRLWMMWWSGLLAAATFVHLMRAMMEVPLRVAAIDVPLWISWLIVPVAGGLSLWLIRRARGIG